MAKALSGSALLGGLSALPGQGAQTQVKEGEPEVFIQQVASGTYKYRLRYNGHNEVHDLTLNKG